MHPSSFRRPLTARRQNGGFALIVTLLILSMLVIVAVSYLSSMTAERQTADAYDARASAAQAAQAGVDNATAMLAECFRDYPDSATVWDTQQTQNGTTPYNTSTIVGGTYNEGTSLYLRAVPKSFDGTGMSNPLVPTGTTVANPLPQTVTYTSNSGTSYAASNDPNGNDPNNPACETFVLPLISGVPNGQPRLVSEKAKMWPITSSDQTSNGNYMNLGQADPAKQNWTDLNVRQISGDTQGIIGSPPNWAGVGPKPARAYWVNLKGSDGLTTGRYAYWIEDESFRANINLLGNTTPRRDNNTNSKAVSLGDGVLAGALMMFDSNSTTHADQVINTRNTYPNKFLPDAAAFLHSSTNGSGTSSFDAATANTMRYVTTTQSGSLNLTRHGSQRLNLNATTTINPSNAVTMTEIDKLVESIRFHLPNFGQRFYRSTNPDLASSASTRSTILNKANDVPNTASSPYTEMYLYKTAANLRDYIDTDDQPTMIVRPLNGAPKPSLAQATAPMFPFGSDGQGSPGQNYMWAQGKDGAPFIQEAMVRYRPAVQNNGESYTLTVDYYVEVWNMSDHDVSAASLGHNPFLRIGNQQQWYSAYIAKDSSSTKPLNTSVTPTPVLPLTVTDGGVSPGDSPPTRDFNLDLLHSVYRADSPSVPAPDGVVFKAGTATVITTDPDFVSTGPTSNPVINSRFIYGGQQLTAAGFYAPNVYYCSSTLPANSASARRTFSGPTQLAYDSSKLRGIMPSFRGPTTSSVYLDFEVETTLGNDLGYLDCALGAFCISAGSGDASTYGSTNGWDFTWTPSGEPHNDYLHGGTLAGNGTTPSELGDPRTNNEQIVLTTFNGTSFFGQPDQARYGSPGKSLAPPFSLGTPNSQYLKPASTASGYTPWSDYYDWPNASYPTASLTAATAPAFIANSALTSIGQLGDIFDPARVIGNVGTYSPTNTRGGGRTLKVGQRDDRFTYDTVGNASPNNTIDNVPASSGWASWRLTDIFGIGDALELPGRININGVMRDKGSALRAALAGFVFQPQTNTASPASATDYLVHGAANLANVSLPYDPTATTGVTELVNQITNRLSLTPASVVNTSTNGYSTPWGPFFERGELGELENNQANTPASSNTWPLFGRTPSASYTATSMSLVGKDFNRTSDRGREELFRRLVELICTRGDTFTVYAVGQSMQQTTTAASAKITGTQHLRVTFRLVPKRYNTTTNGWEDFHPGYSVNASNGTIAPTDFDPESAYNANGTQGINQRFAKPDRYEVQVLSASSY